MMMKQNILLAGQGRDIEHLKPVPCLSSVMSLGSWGLHEERPLGIVPSPSQLINSDTSSRFWSPSETLGQASPSRATRPSPNLTIFSVACYSSGPGLITVRPSTW